MYYVPVVLFALGAALLVVGYRRNRRNLLAASALLLFLSGVGDDFAAGFRDGVTATAPAASAAVAH